MLNHPAIKGYPILGNLNVGKSQKQMPNHCLPSGKHTKNYEKSQFLMGKSTISTGPWLSSHQKGTAGGRRKQPTIPDREMRSDSKKILAWYLVAHPTARKGVITPVISGLTLLIPFITGVITHLLSGMSHQVKVVKHQEQPIEVMFKERT